MNKIFFFVGLLGLVFLFSISFTSAVEVGDSCQIPGESGDINYYCDFSGEIQVKKDFEASCSNNYECQGNSCADGVCKSQFQEIPEQTNFLQTIWNKIIEFFTGGEAVLCEDEDGDGYGSPASELCDYPGEDCDDGDANIHPGASEACDLADNNCDGAIDEGFDTDGDGYTTCGGDCNDGDGNINPGELEICDDGIDNNCGGGVDCDELICRQDPVCETEGESMCDPDIDLPRQCGLTDIGACEYGTQTCTSDGFWGECEGNVEPVEETCNDLDDDCDGQTDEGVTVTYYQNIDGDDYGDFSVSIEACPPGPSVGWLTVGGDCNDNNENIHPDALEICDDEGIDNNCNELVDCDEPSCRTDPACQTGGLGDFGEECTPGISQSCGPENSTGQCNQGTQLCRPNGYWGSCDGAIGPSAEVCDGEDNNCDGSFMENEYDYSTGDEMNPEECSDTLDNDCDGMVDFNDDSCLPFCGNYIIDEELNEQCDLSNLDGYDCLNYTTDSVFSGGVLSCNAPESVNECQFNITMCTVTYTVEDPEISATVSQITGLQSGSIVSIEILNETQLPEGVGLPENSELFFILNITIQPSDQSATIYFSVNKTLVNDFENVGIYLVESDNTLTYYLASPAGEDDVYYNYSVEIPHFSLFFGVETIPYCGDGEIGGSEDCDGGNLNSESCESLGYDSGTLACTSGCVYDLSGCVTDDTGGNGNGGGGGGGGGGGSINILVYSPRQGITYSTRAISLDVADSNDRARFWRYSLNNNPKIDFAPNITIDADIGTNVLKVFARRSLTSSYEAHKLVSFKVVNNPEPYCGDLVCDSGEDCDSCSSDCGSCALIASYCGDGTCDSGENSDNCSADCDEAPGGKSKAVVFAIIIIILLVGIGVVVYFIYNRAKGRKVSAMQQRRRPFAGQGYSRPGY